jgi:hypothetical protein
MKGRCSRWFGEVIGNLVREERRALRDRNHEFVTVVARRDCIRREPPADDAPDRTHRLRAGQMSELIAQRLQAVSPRERADVDRLLEVPAPLR